MGSAITYPTPEELVSRAEAFRSKYVIEANGCWHWTRGLTTSGYGHFWVAPRYYQAHRIAYILHRGPVESAHMDHLCRNRWCVNPWHLEPVEPAVNSQRGSRARLTPDQVTRIREAHADGVSTRALGREYGVDHSTVSRLVNRRTWKTPEQKQGEAAA